MTAQDRLLALREIAGSAAYLARAVAEAGAVPAGARDPALVRRAGVLGAGAMGRGIAMALAQSGRDVVLADPSPEARAAALAHLTALADRSRAKGRLDDAGHAALLARLRVAEGVAAFAGADLVIEAVPEILPLKQRVMAEIEAVTAPDTLITSNTSTLDVDAIAGALARPERFIGTHFFMPAQVNPLLELVPAASTAPETLAATLALAKALGKSAVIAANGDGFIGNRLFDRFYFEAMHLVEEGAWPEEVDAALEAFGFAIGPFRALDMIGNDIPGGVWRQRAARPAPPPQPQLGFALIEAGLFGQKTGKGWYFYDATTPRGRPYEEARALILRVSRALGRTRRNIDPDEIVGRCLTALMVEGLAMIREGRARAAADIDVTYVTGYGFPAAVGGPMRMAETLGVARVFDLARQYGALSGRADTAWAMPTALLERAAE